MMTSIDVMYRIVDHGAPDLVTVVTEQMLRHRVPDLDDQLLDHDNPARHLSDLVREHFAGGSRWASRGDSDNGGYCVRTTERPERVAELLA